MLLGLQLLIFCKKRRFQNLPICGRLRIEQKLAYCYRYLNIIQKADKNQKNCQSGIEIKRSKSRFRARNWYFLIFWPKNVPVSQKVTDCRFYQKTLKNRTCVLWEIFWVSSVLLGTFLVLLGSPRIFQFFLLLFANVTFANVTEQRNEDFLNGFVDVFAFIAQNFFIAILFVFCLFRARYYNF